MTLHELGDRLETSPSLSHNTVIVAVSPQRPEHGRHHLRASPVAVSRNFPNHLAAVAAADSKQFLRIILGAGLGVESR